MNFLAILWNLKSYLMSKQVLAFNKSKYYNSDTTIAFFGRYMYPYKFSAQFRSFDGILTSLEWQSTLKTKLNRFSHGNPRFSLTNFMTFWTILCQTFWHQNRLSIQKNSPIHILRPTQSFDWDIWRFGLFLDRFG